MGTTSINSTCNRLLASGKKRGRDLETLPNNIFTLIRTFHKTTIFRKIQVMGSNNIMIAYMYIHIYIFIIRTNIYGVSRIIDTNCTPRILRAV